MAEDQGVASIDVVATNSKMNEAAQSANYAGVPAMAELAKIATDITDLDHARAIRELVQKECDADSRSHDALVSRGNALLGASGVGVALLVGFSKEASVSTATETTLLIAALSTAILTVAFVLVSVRVRYSLTVMRNTTLFGGDVPLEVASEKEFRRQHELQVALEYADMRLEHEKSYSWRAKWLRNAQFGYLAFLFAAACFAISLPM